MRKNEERKRREKKKRREDDRIARRWECPRKRSTCRIISRDAKT